MHHHKRKLCCYNFTVYEQAETNDGHCYLWSEVDGRRGSNKIGSCLLQYLQSLPNTVQEISMFSDTCDGQNRNQNVAAVLLYAVQSIDHIMLLSKGFWKRGTLTWNATTCILLLSLLKEIVLCLVWQHGV